MIRILHITEELSAAGIESFIMNVYRHINRNEVQFDFMVLRDEKEFYDEEIAQLGGKKYFVSSRIKNTFVRILSESKKIEKFLKNYHYDIVHIHYTTPLRAPYLYAIKKAGVNVRIYHAHSAAVSGKSKLKVMIYNYYRKKITDWATDYFACSKAAAEWIFEKELIDSHKVRVIYNGIDTFRFRFSEDKRKEIRKILNVENNYVLIHTGRFSNQKNQTFILDVFKEVKLKCNNAKLILLGTGDLFQVIKNKAKEMNVSNDVMFLGVKSNVEDYLCAADCYIMPSLYEGLPVAAVEAECAGLPCVFSNNITDEVCLTANNVFLSLEDSIDRWVDAIISAKAYIREDKSEKVREKGYDIQVVSDKLEKLYLTKAEV